MSSVVVRGCLIAVPLWVNRGHPQSGRTRLSERPRRQSGSDSLRCKLSAYGMSVVREARPVTGSLVIRPETDADLVSIATIVEAAFGRRAEALVVERIRASDRYRPDYALVATLDGAVVGHVMVGDVDLVAGIDRRQILCLAPLAVDPALHGGGIGSALV